MPGSLEGEVLAVTKPRATFVGVVVAEGGKLFLSPDDCPFLRLQIKKSAAGGVRAGDKAAVSCWSGGSDYADHRAGVAMRFGSADKARQCVRALLYAAGRTRQFPDKVKAEARAVAEPGPSDFKKRLDLRAEPIFTIDSAETKDIDDAISVTACADGWQLGVHIADVSHYVRAGSAMDKEAMQRGHLGLFCRQRRPHAAPAACPTGCAASTKGPTGWPSPASCSWTRPARCRISALKKPSSAAV